MSRRSHSTPCPFCQGVNHRQSHLAPALFNQRLFHYVKCQSCHLIFVAPELSDADYQAMYSPDYHNEFYFSDAPAALHHKTRSLLKQHAPGRLLDFGCGDGNFITQAMQLGYQCTGIEFDTRHVEKLKQAYPTQQFMTIDEWASHQDQYDLIHLGDVFEHLTQPDNTMKTLCKQLTGNGHMLIEGPLEANDNLAYLFRKWLGKIKQCFRPNFHVTHPPYHVLITNRHNQLQYFEKLQLTTKHFSVHERAWPFTKSIREIRNVNTAMQFFIGKFSIFTSLWIPTWGNRFIYMGRKPNDKASNHA